MKGRALGYQISGAKMLILFAIFAITNWYLIVISNCLIISPFLHN
uniref:Uncharacterized protein n=1 Tax=Tetranychus urticae TaxID=32264 RepID=T1K4J3_TETUR